MNKEAEGAKLVLARLETLNPESKVQLGSGREVSVQELIQHVKRNDEFGRQAVKAHLRMLKVLAGSA